METILLVDDEDNVRRLIRAILQRDGGYRVIEACNAEEALKHYNQRPEDFDLVLTDCVMPGTSGLDLALRLRAQCPKLKLICMSGYPTEGLEAIGASFLEKPLLPDALLDKVRQVLGEDKAA